jgi:CDP-diacylglycerol---serine O-phosphatidyltransferase
LRQIPNFFTLLNLVFGCIAIVLILQTGETIVYLESMGTTQVMLPEKIWWGAIFIFAAAVVDFLDGFLARMLKASSEMGKQLDSLSDVVSFGVAPSMIIYQLLRISFAQEENGLDISVAWLLPAFLFVCAVAWRLAKFNISTTQSYSFIGVPSPAAALAVASLPLCLAYQRLGVEVWIINKWVLYTIIILLAYLMICNRRFIAFKFKGVGVKENWEKYTLAIAAVILILLLGWLAVPAIFVLYLILSAFVKEPVGQQAQKETVDVTV